jgi:pimeloyl-ACP methyl ester carboxylesterase
MDDIRAVMDDAGSVRAALLGAGSPGDQLCAVFAATYPERVVALMLHNSWLRVVSAPDFPMGDTVEQWHQRVRQKRLKWGDRDFQLGELRRYFPSRAGDPELEHWHVNHERLAASPGAAAWFLRVLMETDIREVLPTISVPSLVMYLDRYRDGCLYLAERIPNAEVLRDDRAGHQHLRRPGGTRRGGALPLRGACRLRARACPDHRPLHGHRRVDLAGGRAW